MNAKKNLIQALTTIVRLKTYEQPKGVPIYIDSISKDRLPSGCVGVAIKYAYMPPLRPTLIDDIRAEMIRLGYKCLYIRYNAAKHHMQSTPGMRFAFYTSEDNARIFGHNVQIDDSLFK